MSEYEKPYLILSKAINEAIKNIDSNEKEIIKKY